MIVGAVLLAILNLPGENALLTTFSLVVLVAGTAPASVVAVLLLDSAGNTVGSVNTTRFDDPHFAFVSFWLIETAKHPVYASLRAIDRDGNVVAEYPGRGGK